MEFAAKGCSFLQPSSPLNQFGAKRLIQAVSCPPSASPHRRTFAFLTGDEGAKLASHCLASVPAGWALSPSPGTGGRNLARQPGRLGRRRKS